MSNQVNDENVGLLKQLVTTVQKKNDKEKVDNSIKMKPAKVIGVDEDTYKVFAYFIDDTEQNAYTFYNKSGEVLTEGDNVRVYYTTNPAKGWIGLKSGATIGDGITINNNNTYTTAIHFTATGFDLTFNSSGGRFVNTFTVTEDGMGNITKITNETAGRSIDVSYD